MSSLYSSISVSSPHCCLGSPRHQFDFLLTSLSFPVIERSFEQNDDADRIYIYISAYNFLLIICTDEVALLSVFKNHEPSLC